MAKHDFMMGPRKPRRWWLWGLATVLVLIGWAMYCYIRPGLSMNVRHLVQERNQLRAKNRSLGKQLQAAKQSSRHAEDQLVYIKRSGQIDANACQMVKKSLSGLQQQNADLREQLAFYRGIVSPKQSSEGLRVYDFKVTPNPHKAGRYDYELLLIQPMHHDHTVRGQARLVISGMLDGAAKRYVLSALSVSGKRSLDFSFKYFQEFDGSIALPGGFRPMRVAVTLAPSDGKTDIKQTYDWNKIVRTDKVR